MTELCLKQSFRLRFPNLLHFLTAPFYQLVAAVDSGVERTNTQKVDVVLSVLPLDFGVDSVCKFLKPTAAVPTGVIKMQR